MNIKYRYLLVVSGILIIIGFVITTVLIYKATKRDYEEFDFKISDNRKLFVYEKMIEEYRRRAREGPEIQGPARFYQKRPETQHVDCKRVLSSDKEYIKTLTGSSRTPLIEDPHLDMSCKALKSRIFPEHLKLKLRPLSAGVAFARIVYRDYEFIERQVQVSYHPQNLFCFAVDKKAPAGFQEKIRRLGECLENVIVLLATHSYDSNGHNTNLAHYQCMEASLKYPNWTYFVTQENHDVVVKTVYELDKIYEILGGTNDVGINPLIVGRTLDWFKLDPKSLKLFRNETGIDPKVLNTPLKPTTKYKHASLSRAAVDWMVHTVDPLGFIDLYNHSRHGGDEQWLSTFQSNSQLGMPGHFVHDCLDQGFVTDQVTRMTKWHERVISECSTRTIRHSICLQGIEDLPSVARMPNIMFNKMIPSFDYSIIECTAELLYNRTFLGQVDQKLDEEYYKNMINVLYHKNHLDPNYQLNCTPSYKVWEYKSLW